MNEDKKEDGQKPMKLPRFSYQVPEDLTSDFLQEMKADFRETPSELITAVLRRHFQQRTEERMLRGFTAPEESQGFPRYGRSPEKPNADQGPSQTAGREKT